MKQDKEEWVVSPDGENYNGYMTYPTKELAIETGRKEFASVKKVNIQKFLMDIYVMISSFMSRYFQDPNQPQALITLLKT